MAKFAEIATQGPISILVNNASILHIVTVESKSEEDFDRVFRVNVKGYYNSPGLYCAPEEPGWSYAEHGIDRGVDGLRDRFAYSVSKGATLAMTNSAARDYFSYKIRWHTPFLDLQNKKLRDWLEAVIVLERANS